MAANPFADEVDDWWVAEGEPPADVRRTRRIWGPLLYLVQLITFAVLLYGTVTWIWVTAIPITHPKIYEMAISCAGMMFLALCFVAALWASQPDRFRRSRSRLFVVGVALLCLAVVLAAFIPVVERIRFEPHRHALEQLATDLSVSSGDGHFQSGSARLRSIDYPVIRIETYPEITVFILRHSGVGPYEREGLALIRNDDQHPTIEECWDLDRFTGDWYHAMWTCPGG